MNCKESLHLKIDHRLVKFTNDYVCMKKTNKSHLVAKLLADELGLKLDKHFELDMDSESIKSFKQELIKAKINLLEKELEALE
jgi:hypothetical protein